MKRNKKGFTLVEIIVVLAIIAILAVMVGGSLFAYMKSSKYRKNNDFARSVYIAAQNALSQKKVNGTLEEWFASPGVQAAVVELGPAGAAVTGTVSPAVSPDGQEDWLQRNFELVYNNDDSGLTELEKESLARLQEDSKLYALIMPKGDQTSQLWKLIQDYVPGAMDEGENGSALIEFNPVTGQVYAAFYSDRLQTYSYGSGKLEESGTADPGQKVLRGNDDAKRRELMLGYYNVWQIGEPELPDKEESSLQYTLVNGRLRDGSGMLTKAESSDSLYLKVKLLTLPAADSAVTYRLTFCNQTGVALEKSVTDPAVKADMVPELLFTIKRKAAPAPTEAPYEYSGCAYIPNAGGSGFTRYPLLLQFVPGQPEQFNIVLDAIDLYATTDRLLEGTSGLENIRNTYSAGRFGIPSQVITVKLAEAAHSMSGVEASNAESLYFAQQEQTGVDWEIQLADMRHLYNLRYVATPDTNLPEAFRKNYETYFQSNGKTVFVQKEDLDWKKSAEKGRVFRGRTESLIPGADETSKDETAPLVESWLPAAVTTAGTAAGEAAFPSIPFLPYSEAAGGGLKSGNGIYDAGYNEGAKRALFKIRNLVIAEKTDRPAGLFRNMLGQVQNLWLEDVTVEGINDVGAVAGRNFGILGQDLTVPEIPETRGSILVTGSVTGTGTGVGGVAGSDGLPGGAGSPGGGLTASTGRSQYSHVSAGVVLKRQGTAAAEGARLGGIVGEVNGAAGSVGRKTVMTDCRFTDVIIAGTGSVTARRQKAELISDGSYNGGLAGYVAKGAEIEAKGCLYAGNLAYGKLEDAAKAVYRRGSYTGGLFGFCQGKLKMENCRVSGEAADTGMPEDNTVYITGRDCVGGILGKLDEGAEAKIVVVTSLDPSGRSHVDSYGAQVRNSVQVEGNNFVGGFAGVNAADSLFDASGSMSFLDGMAGVGPKNVKGRNFVGGIFGGNALKARSSTVIGTGGGVELFVGAATRLEAAGSCAGSFSGLWAAGAEDAEKSFLTAAADETTDEAQLEALFTGWSKEGSPCTFRGLKNSAGRIVAKNYAGGIVGYTTKGSRITFDNCVNENGTVAAGRVTKNAVQDEIIEPEGSYAGGIVSVNYGTISKCSNAGTVTGAAQVGGIAGSNGMPDTAGTPLITDNCVNQGEILGDLENVGGICGRQTGDNSSILRADNRGNVSFVGIAEKTGDDAVRRNLGGIVGLCEGGVVEEVGVWADGSAVKVTAEGVTGPAEASGKDARFYSNIGGVVGNYKGKSLKIKAEKIAVNVLAPNGQNVGGLIGLADGILGSGNEGYSIGQEAVCTVRGYEQTGGLIGRLGPDAGWASTGGMLQASDKVTVTGRYADAGGLIGYVEGQAAAEGKKETLPSMNMRSSANVNGSAVNMGGLIGHIYYAGTLQVSGDHTWVYAGNVTAGDAENSAGDAYRYFQTRDENGSKIGPGCVGGIAGLMEGPVDQGTTPLKLELKGKDSWQANSGLKVYNASCAGSYIGRFRGTGMIKNIRGGNRVEAYYNGWMENLPKGEGAYVQGYVGGLFGYVDTAEVESCVYEGAGCEIAVTVDGSEPEAYASYIGGLTGANGRAVKNSANAGKISLEYKGGHGAYAAYIGGISGKSYGDGLIRSCTVESEVKGGSRGRFVGGVTGENFSPLDCSNTVKNVVSGDSNVGGYTGANRSLIQDEEDHTNQLLSVSASTNAGGVAGYNMGTITVQNLPQTNVAGNYSGGIAGNNGNGGVIRKFGDKINNDSNREAVHTVRGREVLGGIAGENSGTISPDGSTTQEAAAKVDSAAGRVPIIWSPKAAILDQDEKNKCVSAGGVTGSNSGLLMNLNFDGVINTAAPDKEKLPLKAMDTVGGITAYAEQGSRILNCSNAAQLQLLRLYPEAAGASAARPVAAGGIAAAADGDTEFTGCVNAGTFIFPASYVTDQTTGAVALPTKDTVHAAGILGDNKGAAGTAKLNQCRSYATAYLEAADGSRAGDREVLRGLYCAPMLGSESRTVITDSFNFADLRYPVSDMTLKNRISGSAYFFDHHAPQAVSDSESVVEVPNEKDTSGWGNIVNTAQGWEAENNNYQTEDLKQLLRSYDSVKNNDGNILNSTVYYRANYSRQGNGSSFEWFFEDGDPALAINGSFQADSSGNTSLTLSYALGSDNNYYAKPSVWVLREDGTKEKAAATDKAPIKTEGLGLVIHNNMSAPMRVISVGQLTCQISGKFRQILIVPGKGTDIWNPSVAGMAIYAVDVTGEFDPTEVKSYYQGFHAGQERQDPDDGKNYYVYCNKDDTQVVLSDNSSLFAANELYPGVESWGYDESGKKWNKPARGSSGSKGMYEIFDSGISELLQNGAISNNTGRMRVMRLSARNISIPLPELQLYRQAGGLQILLTNPDLFEGMGLWDWLVHVSITLEDGTIKEKLFSKELTDLWLDLSDYKGSIVTICYYLEAGGSPLTQSVYYDINLNELQEAPPVSGNSVSENTVSGNTVSENTVSGNTVSVNTVSNNTVPENPVSGNTGTDNTVSNNTASENPISGNTGTDNTVSNNTASENPVSGNTGTDNTVPDQTAKENTVSENFGLDGIVPGSDLNAGITSPAVSQTLSENSALDHS